MRIEEMRPFYKQYFGICCTHPLEYVSMSIDKVFFCAACNRTVEPTGFITKRKIA